MKWIILPIIGLLQILWGGDTDIIEDYIKELKQLKFIQWIKKNTTGILKK